MEASWKGLAHRLSVTDATTANAEGVVMAQVILAMAGLP
jgi:hypothetical protein